MEHVNIDPTQGLHAAAKLSNSDLEYLLELILWELAVRTDREQFEVCLRNAIARREDSERQVQELRHQRDLMQFAAQVMRDIQQLPGTTETDDPAPGLYL